MPQSTADGSAFVFTSSGGRAHPAMASSQDRGSSRIGSRILNMSARTGVPNPFRPRAKTTVAVDAEGPGPLPTWPAAALLYPRPADVERPTLQYLDPPAQPTAPGRWRVLSSLGRTRNRARDPEQQQQPQAHPRRFLGVLPWIQSRQARAYATKCLVSVLFLALLLIVYLILTVTKSVAPNSLTVLGVFVVILTIIFFFYNLIRMSLVLLRPPRHDIEVNGSQMTMSDEGYAMPREPIRVVLAADEDMEGLGDPAARPKPPEYGYWRESVRVNPDALFWQRNMEATHDERTTNVTTAAGRRPPSYVSEDGVSYVVEAVPRSTSSVAAQTHLSS